MKPIRVYVAGKFTAQDRLRKIAERLLEDGRFNVTSAWLWEAPNAAGDRRRALFDEMQVQASDLLVLDIEEESSTGGREVEFGIALGRKISTVVIGKEPRNIFHPLATFQFDCWEDFFTAVAKYSGQFSCLLTQILA